MPLARAAAALAFPGAFRPRAGHGSTRRSRSHSYHYVVDAVPTNTTPGPRRGGGALHSNGAVGRSGLGPHAVCLACLARGPRGVPGCRNTESRARWPRSLGESVQKRAPGKRVWTRARRTGPGTCHVEKFEVAKCRSRSKNGCTTTPVVGIALRRRVPGAAPSTTPTCGFEAL